MIMRKETNSADPKCRLIEVGQRLGWWRIGTAFSYYCRHLLFKGVELRGRRMLDIGCGNGRFCMWAAVHGAAEVLGLEPSEAGSRGNQAVQKFREAVHDLGLTNVSIREQTFQEAALDAGRWDIVLLHASINHLDEAACIRLRDDESARETYRGLFRKLRQLMPRGGHLILTDCARRNLFADLGLRNPFVPTIEWHKHQQPETWIELLGPCGFVRPRITWCVAPEAGHLGAVFRNRLCAYLTRSYFRMTLEAD